MNKDETIKEIFEATRNVIPGEYDTIDLFYKWYVNKQIELLREMYNKMFDYIIEDMQVKSDINDYYSDKIKELKGK